MKKHLPILASTLALYGCPEPNDPAIDTPDLVHTLDMDRLSDLNNDLPDQIDAPIDQNNDILEDMAGIDMNEKIECTDKAKQIRTQIENSINGTLNIKKALFSNFSGDTLGNNGFKFTFENNPNCQQINLIRTTQVATTTQEPIQKGRYIFLEDKSSNCIAISSEVFGEQKPFPEPTPKNVGFYTYFINLDQEKIYANFTTHTQHNFETTIEIPDQNKLETKIKISPDNISGTFKEEPINIPLCDEEYQKINTQFQQIF